MPGVDSGDREDDAWEVGKNIPSQSSRTLLPRPVASLVSLFTHSTSLSLRIGTFLGGFALDSARATTLTGLELSRAVVESILVRAGRDVALQSTEYGRAQAESLLERSLATLHSSITSASFFASAGFHLSSMTLNSFSDFSQNLLSTLDAILGSSESSRAIAAIITLIIREFRSKESKYGGQRAGVADLLVGSTGFALLQRWGRRATEREMRDSGKEETVWDVVILDNGLRADVVGTQQIGYPEDIDTGPTRASTRASSFILPDDTDRADVFRSVGHDTARRNTLGTLLPHVSLPADHQHELSDEEIRVYIMNQLPEGTRASINTDTVTSRTITVDFYDDDVVDLSPPPGAAMIAERFHHLHDVDPGDTTRGFVSHLLKHTVVFRTSSNHSNSAELRKELSGTLYSSADRSSASGPHSSNKRKPKKRGDISTTSDPSFNNTMTIPDSCAENTNCLYGANLSSSMIDSGLQQGSLGKGSLSNFTQKVVSNTEDKASHRLPPLKKIFTGLTNVALSSQDKQDNKSDDENIALHNASRNPSLKNPAGKSNITETAQPTSPMAKRLYYTEKALPRVPSKHESLNHKRSFGNLINPHPNGPRMRSPSRSSYISVQGKTVDSYTAQTDAYSLHPTGSPPSSPTKARNHVRSSSALSRTLSEKDIAILVNDDENPRPLTPHRKGSIKSLAPSTYSIADAGSETSLVLATRPTKSVYEDQATILALQRDGRVPGVFPDDHIVKNIQRFSRFSSASYGSNFLRVMGIGNKQPWQKDEFISDDHHEHCSFSKHTGLPASTILLSSFVDPAGGSNAAGETAEGFPLVHYLSLDHASKAVVLTLRGTWGFEDILTDMTCDYDDLYWLGRTWQVHKGMHASARRLLEGGGGRVMATIRAALEEFPEYGVIFCGHSLGGGVASLLATMISRPKDADKSGPSFVTASKPSSGISLLPSSQQRGQLFLPAGRPIHVYAFGPPAVMCPSLRLATRGLITTVVNGQDVVPTLSLGVLLDFHAVSMAFKSDMSDAKAHVRSRVWESITARLVNKFYVDRPPLLVHAGDRVGEDSWAWATLKSLRETLVAPKLLPPGEVFVVETMRVLQRDAFTLDAFGSADGSPRLGRPATRVQLKFIRDVETRFREVRFGSGMLGDHSPGRYEASLAVLARGVLED
ncbi:esterase/lipase [Blastomyces gilchristii SLH14081]|uniref:sn-1-specific diacylglycerol lipase n=1 Tax=Blastomyces gilchristii (strain SLH14081) TaxID=559298 RepID=A0A179V425_BLAGS|nr:esterase/lipase [Blastomyces gilchristii SLH14081]OAT13342.1 esterase/lipase [Blastomyces gilchristii SLH14081]